MLSPRTPNLGEINPRMSNLLWSSILEHPFSERSYLENSILGRGILEWVNSMNYHSYSDHSQNWPILLNLIPRITIPGPDQSYTVIRIDGKTHCIECVAQTTTSMRWVFPIKKFHSYRVYFLLPSSAKSCHRWDSNPRHRDYEVPIKIERDSNQQSCEYQLMTLIITPSVHKGWKGKFKIIIIFFFFLSATN